jgi:D-aminopeptidase
MGDPTVKKFLIAAAVAAAMVVPSMLLAADDTAMKSDLTVRPTYMCHPATASATPNATMGSITLTCKPIDAAKMKDMLIEVHGMETNMNAPTRAEVEEMVRAITQDMYGG